MKSELQSLIAQVRRRWFVQVALWHAGRAAAFASVPVFAALLVDVVFTLEGGALIAIAAVTTVASLGLAAWVLHRMQRRPDDRHVARFIEERVAAASEVGPLDDALVSAVDVAEAPAESPAAAFVPLIVASAVHRLRDIPPEMVIPPAAIRRSAMQSIAGTVALTLALVLGAPALLRAVDTARVRLFPGSIVVEVVPGSVRVPAGTPVRIRATLRGGESTIARFPPALTVAAGGEQRTVRMMPQDGAFEFAFESIDRSFTYRVTAGAARSDEYTVTALFPPRVKRIDVGYAYPSFTGLPPREEEDGGDIYAPVGTRVRIRVHADKPIASGHMALRTARGAPLAMRPAAERVLEAELVLKADDSYRIALADRDGLRTSGETEYFIRLMDDRPPDVRILRPSADQSITPLEEVSIEARADDDYGISRFELVYSVAGGPERVVPFTTTTGTDIQRVGSRMIAAEDLKVKPGDVIAYYARAWDVGRGKRPTRAQSDIFFLEVKPFSEEFVMAQSQAGGGGAQGAQLEALVAAQKEIISATWNIERRAQGGVSAEDLKQVAQAQAELRARVEQLISRSGRGGGRPPAPERVAPQAQPRGRGATSQSLASALEAMSKAIQQLEAQKTKEAIPHEMAALNGLLEVQAEIRRREISRQNNSGGSGGSNRSGQDLSALFDRELQRQQRTNYENPSRVEERAERNETSESAADRIRDLARRQEDLSRRQRDLANAGLSVEEMKRQLERLTREQQELRERAEELAREVAGQQGQQPGQQSGQQQGRSGQQLGAGAQPGQAPQAAGSQASGVRDASEQMRNAADELKRDDAKAAAESGDRAAEQLRRLEQQMRQGNADAGRRAAGELQAEAQQIAQEQRRIAAEAERLESTQGSAAAEARRRLADDKDRLAGRVDELQRAARQQAQRDPKAQGAGALGEAARELEAGRIGQRMRETAREMRGGQSQPAAQSGRSGGEQGSSGLPQPPKGAAAEQEIARALERAIGGIGGNASAEARQLSDQLNQTRDMRDRLNRLEQQMREAEAKDQAAQRGRPGSQGREGQQGSRGASGGGQGGADLERLQQEYQRELQKAQEALGRLTSAQPRDGTGTATPEQHEFSRSAPGTEGFKQDRSAWESLRRNLDSALEKYETAVSDRLARKLAEDRLSAGGSDRVPDSYRRRIARYYESLSTVKK